MNQDKLLARSAIESLRSGVPSRHAVAQLGTTQSEVKVKFDSALKNVADNNGTDPIAIAADFGQGKTHLLSYLQTLAEQQNFVTAYVVVSPEMPMGNSHVVLKTIAESAHAPGRLGKALSALAIDLNASSSAFVAAYGYIL